MLAVPGSRFEFEFVLGTFFAVCEIYLTLQIKGSDLSRNLRILNLYTRD